MKQMLAGQIFLVLCCAFYIPWWFVVFRPGSPQNWVAGRAGVLLALTALCGLVGLVLTVVGMNIADTTRRLYSTGLICIFGIAVYIGLLLFTRAVFHRPVTTELVLITGWTVLELTAVNAAYGARQLGTGKSFFVIALILIAFVINMILYVLYYRMEAWAAYHWAAVPLGLDGAVMAVFVILMCV